MDFLELIVFSVVATTAICFMLYLIDLMFFAKDEICKYKIVRNDNGEAVELKLKKG